MSEQRDRPTSDILYRMILLFNPLLGQTIDYRRLLEESGVKEGQTVLDFGCGPGNAAIPAAEMVGENGKVYAFGYSPSRHQIC